MVDAAGARHDLRRRDPAADGPRSRGVGSAHSLYLTIFDQGDAILDSAVFLDNLRFETIDAAKCKSLAVDPFEGLTGVSPMPGNPPKLSKDKSTLTFPVSCNLPPGPVSCNVTASAGFIPTPGRVATGRLAALAAVTTTGVRLRDDRAEHHRRHRDGDDQRRGEGRSRPPSRSRPS